MKRIPKLVLTGGPCAGKSTAMERIVCDLRECGYEPIVVPEAATALMRAGFVISEMGSYAFQRTLICLQAEQERIYEQGAQCLPHARPILLCDRGRMDGKAYMSDAEFAKMLGELDLQEAEILASYDAVFHMETVARRYPRAYSNANNATRYEATAEAVGVDDRLQQIWSAHPSYHFVSAHTTFLEKYEGLREQILAFLSQTEEK